MPSMESRLQATTLDMNGFLLQYCSRTHKRLNGTVTQILARPTGIHKPCQVSSLTVFWRAASPQDSFGKDLDC